MQCSLCLCCVLVACLSVSVAVLDLSIALKCDFETNCLWGWDNKFRNISGASLNCSTEECADFPKADYLNRTDGHFLLFASGFEDAGGGGGKGKGRTASGEQHIWSPEFVGTSETCMLQMWLHMRAMNSSRIKVVVETSTQNSWIAYEKDGNSNGKWEMHQFRIGRVLQEFKVLFEVVPALSSFHVAVDDITLDGCFPKTSPDIPSDPDVQSKECPPSQFQCANKTCLDENAVCDINIDCPNGEDEKQDCDKVPSYARCSFETNWCGWKVAQLSQLPWKDHRGPTPTKHTGPSADHTFKNNSGVYLYVDMSKPDNMPLGSTANLDSEIFNPPPFYHSNVSSPHYNSCHITFHYHQYGPHSGSLALSIIVIKGKEESASRLFWSSGDQGDVWHRVVVILPNITHRYFYRFEARKGYSARGDVAIDDVSISPKCFGFGLGVTESDLNGYNYEKAGLVNELMKTDNTHADFFNKTYYVLASCGAKGRFGPSAKNCTDAYNKTEVEVTVMNNDTLKGVQKWTVPESGLYTIIAKGASGGKGSSGQGTSLGAEARGVFEFVRGQQLYILVGQEGSSACRKTEGISSSPSCKPIVMHNPSDNSSRGLGSKISDLKNLKPLEGGGGGGGASFVFQIKQNGARVPLLVAAGGGGLAYTSAIVNKNQHGHYENKSVEPVTGFGHGLSPAGAGGGLKPGNVSRNNMTGLSLYEGGMGGGACYWGANYRNISSEEFGGGGFGGGGGGCHAGGGGGGYKGGDSFTGSIYNGEGGWSKASGNFARSRSGLNNGPGEVIIIPALSTPACRCDYRCIALDENREDTICICPETWILDANGRSCIPASGVGDSSSWALILTIVCIFLILIIGSLCIFLYNGYQRKKEAMIQRKKYSGPELQLSRLRSASNNMMTEFNPNYEFGGGTYTIQDLKDIPRDNLSLVKALGQGAFGEVYQGLYKRRVGDAVEMPVAVKTLPELSTNQAETDFLMEALIMSKFNHPNIVHFIGVCFDKHPRFIVIELLAGGDLKTFLRESRPKPDRPSQLRMKDLLTAAIDVAKGCKYMEDNRFIHRDIAARNCLLTTKGPGRVVKIADFGMARDIYRADYYKKGGKAMLPIKWMPPEAFLDGIFTSKTDVWSFGVLLWEVMSLGYMPYTGCANREVMTLITTGGRLEPPSNCPPPLYAIMTQCWHPIPEERPNFSTILERLGYCLQDPDVINSALPVFNRLPSSERDATIMRPSGEDCIQPDYLIPTPGPIENWDATSAQIPESKSTQPLLSECSDNSLNRSNGNNNISRNTSTREMDKQPIPYVNVSVDNNLPYTISGQLTESPVHC